MSETRFLLSERTNPHATGGWWGHPSRRGTITAVVVHTAECNPSAGSALNVARWQATTAPAPSSYHVIVDSDHTVRTVLDHHTAFHVRSFNSTSVGLSFATRASLWGRYPTWDLEALSRGAATARQWMGLYGIPVRWLTRDQALDGVKGFVRHSTMDPSRRTDPGKLFPAGTFFDLLNGKDDDMTDDERLMLKAIYRQLCEGGDPSTPAASTSRTIRDRTWQSNSALGRMEKTHGQGLADLTGPA